MQDDSRTRKGTGSATPTSSLGEYHTLPASHEHGLLEEETSHGPSERAEFYIMIRVAEEATTVRFNARTARDRAIRRRIQEYLEG